MQRCCLPRVPHLTRCLRAQLPATMMQLKSRRTPSRLPHCRPTGAPALCAHACASLRPAADAAADAEWCATRCVARALHRRGAQRNGGPQRRLVGRRVRQRRWSHRSSRHCLAAALAAGVAARVAAAGDARGGARAAAQRRPHALAQPAAGRPHAARDGRRRGRGLGHVVGVRACARVTQDARCDAVVRASRTRGCWHAAERAPARAAGRTPSHVIAAPGVRVGCGMRGGARARRRGLSGSPQMSQPVRQRI